MWLRIFVFRHIYQGSIRAGTPAGTMVLLGGSGLEVSDPDLNDEVKLQLLGKGSDQFRLDPETGKVFYKGGGFRQIQDNNQDKLYLRIRATDAVGHITESQLVIHIVEEDEARSVTF